MQVFWLGGSPCAGKSTVAALLAERHGLRLYSCDSHFDRHRLAADIAGQPTLVRFRAASWTDIFLQPLSNMVRDEIAAGREEFPMVVADLAALPPGKPVLAEGTALLPGCVAALRPRPDRVAWLVPSAAFQRAHYTRRDWAASLVAGLPEPDRAFENWMRRDQVYARWVRAQARRHGYPAYVVENGHAITAVTTWVEHQLGLASESG